MTWREGYEQWPGWETRMSTVAMEQAFLAGAKWAAKEMLNETLYRSCECPNDVVEFHKRLEAE